MKKLLCIIMVFVILSGFCACHVQEESTESTGSSQISGMPPPRMMMAYSEEAWTAVIDSAKLSDAAFAEFVAQASVDPDDQISIPSNTEKQEVEALVQFIETVGIPMLKSDVKPEKASFEYRPETYWFGNFYIIDGIKYVFIICPHNGNIIRSKGEADVVWTIGEDSISLNRDREYRNGKYLKGRLYRGDYVVAIDIFDDKGEKYIDLQTIAPIEFVWSYGSGGADREDIPRILNFDSIQAYNDLIAAAELSEERLQAFLSSNHYDMNGIHTKEDILLLQDYMVSVPFPVLENGELAVFDINMDQYTVFVRYRTDSQVSVQFRIYPDTQTSKSDMTSAIEAAGASAEVLAADGGQELYYTGTEERGGKTVLTYAADVSGFFVQIEVFDVMRENADRQLQSATFEPLK